MGDQSSDALFVPQIPLAVLSWQFTIRNPSFSAGFGFFKYLPAECGR